MTKKRITFRVDEDIKQHFQIHCIKKEKSMSEILNELITHYLMGDVEIEDREQVD